jgi:hypothetical protein
MNPVDLRARVEEEIRSRIDGERWDLGQKAEKAEVATIDDILGKWQRAISTHDQE